jgi:hypothetical protein
LVLFVAGLLMPFLIATVILFLYPENVVGQLAQRPAVEFAVGFGLVAELLAVVLGFVARRHISGQIGIAGAITVLLLILVTMAGVALSR